MSLKIEGEIIDPYFILGVTSQDSKEIVDKMFKKKAKLLHPDKSLIKDEKIRDKNFRILKESYEYIKKNLEGASDSFSLKDSFNNYIYIKSETSQNFDPDQFNKNFDEKRRSHPNDFGYKVNRMQTIDEYDKFDYKPKNIFGEKNFDSDKFNKMFEYNQKNDQSKDKGLVHQTSDGFWAYNSGNNVNGNLNSGSISSYNGLILTGDDLGQKDIGYYGDSFSDYKHSFSVQNPQMTFDEMTHQMTNDTNDKYDVPLSKNDYNKRLQELQNEREQINIVGGTGADFRLANEKFEGFKRQNMKNDIERSKQLILEYKDLYPQHLIDSALKGELETSKDSFGETFDPSLSWEENINMKSLKKINHSSF